MHPYDKHGNEIKANDRVRVLDDNTASKRFVGEIATVDEVKCGSVVITFEDPSKGSRWHWTTEKLELATHERDRPNSRIEKLLQTWHRASSYSNNPGEIIRAGDKLIEALLADANLLNLDTASSASRGHYIETGRFLFEGEAE